jgi:hypothetical protein
MESSSSGSSITGSGVCGEDEVEDEETSETSGSRGLSDDETESSESVEPTMLRRLRRRGVDGQPGSCDVSAPTTPVRVYLRPFLNDATTSSDSASGVEEQKVVKLLICRGVAYNRSNHIL